jgi:hypothetical protein
MKNRIIKLLICITLVFTILTSTTNAINLNFKKNNLKICSIEDDVPVWKIGETWTFIVNTIDQISESGHLQISIGDLPLKVTGDSGLSYQVEFKTNFNGFYETPQEQDPYIKANFKNSKMEGDISFRKTDLGIEEINIKLSGGLGLNIDSSSLPFPFPSIPLPYTININLNFDNGLALFDFPLDINKIWNLAQTNLIINGNMHSLWLYLINFINKIYPIIDPEIASLLPVIDIKEALELMLGSNIISFPEIPMFFACLNKEMRTVAAGSFEAYNITLLGVGNIYYAPEMGNFIDISLSNFKMELKKHTTSIDTCIKE